MTITLVKQQPGSWQGKPRRQLALFSRISASDWDGLFEIADGRQCGTRRIIREALHEYIVRHRSEAARNEVRITVSGGDGDGILRKIVHSVFGGPALPTE